jgi:2-polyprenyl-3-methyl-5-hydroxy-6-metoxy-1,4-benzoquinol methylase
VIDSKAKIGAYARKQLLGANAILGWSHRARFHFALRLVRSLRPTSLLDYGCGDGTFLLLLGEGPTSRNGFDTDAKQVRDCQARLGAEIRFLSPREIGNADLDGQFDVITCMEVLEHCLPEQRAMAFRRIHRLLKPDGKVLFSMPVEIGPTLLGKQLVRAFLAFSRVGHYEHREKYGPREFLKMLFAGPLTSIDRPVYEATTEDGTRNVWHGHKGFNWRATALELEKEFRVESRHFTPLPLSRGFCSSQAWFLCGKRSTH